MKNRCILFTLLLVLHVVLLSACCTVDELSVYSMEPITIPTSDLLPEPVQETVSVNSKIVEAIFSYKYSHFFDENPTREKLQDMVRACFDNEIQKDSFVCDYLMKRGMYETAPNGVYGYGRYTVDYYSNKEQSKYSFIFHENMSEGKYYENIYCITFSQDDLVEIGSIAYEYDVNQNISYEEIYTTETLCAAYANYEYYDGIPFPIVTDCYTGYTELEEKHLYDDVFHINQRFWLEKQFAVVDEMGRVEGYNADLYDWQDRHYGEIFNDFVYDETDKLIAIYEEFSKEDGTDTSVWDFASDITLQYREDDSLNTVDYSFYYMGFDNRNRGTSDSTGKMFYDEKSRMVYRTYYMTHGSHSCFYLYEGDSKRPWAYIELGGLAYSGDDVSESGFGISVYLFQLK